MARDHVSYSELSTFQQCPLKWWLNYELGFRQDPSMRKPALAKGTVWHAMLEAWFLELRRADEEAGVTSAYQSMEARSATKARKAAIEALERTIAEEPVAGSADTVEDLLWMLDGHEEAWGVDENWEIVGVEVNLDVRLVRIGRKWITLQSKLDLLVRDRTTGRFWVVDHKTAKGRDASSATFSSEMDLDSQFALYQGIVNRSGILGDERVAGAIYDMARTDKLKREMVLSERFGRHRIVRSDHATDRAWDNAVNTAKAIGRTRRKSDPLPIYASPNPGECKWKCDFKEVHLHADATGRGYDAVAAEFGFVSREDRS